MVTAVDNCLRQLLELQSFFNHVTAMSTMIHLVDVNTVLEVPQSILPTMQDPMMDHLEDYLGSLYLDGNTKCDSYDVGLSLTTPFLFGCVRHQPAISSDMQ